MQHKKIDLTKHIPQNPFIKGVMMVIAAIGLLGLWGSLTHADLQIQSTINNVVSTFKELRITSDGSSQGATKVILNTGGIWVDTGALGGPTNGVLKVTPQGYVYRALISGADIAANSITGLQIQDGSITTGMLSFSLSGSSGGSGGVTSLTCPAGQAVVGVTNNVAQCAPIIGTGDCSMSGGVMGWSSTGVLLCVTNSGTSGNQGSAGGYWHLAASGSSIFYGTWADDNNGNVGVGLNSPLAKLHVRGSFRVDTSGSVVAFLTGGSVGGVYNIASLKGFNGGAGYCTTMVDCWMSSAFNSYVGLNNTRGVEALSATQAAVYTEDPSFTHYHWLYSTIVPRCSCDISDVTIDCTNTHVSNHIDPYCVDIADSAHDATYPGPGSTPGYPNTPIPVQFYSYAGPYNGNVMNVAGATPGLIAAAARVGVNTLAPTASLDVLGSIRFRSYVGAGIRNLGVDANGNVVLMPAAAPGANPWITATSGTIYYYGAVGINTSTPWSNLHVGGDILASSYYMLSDQTLKENIVPISDALSKLLTINGYRFRWKSTGKVDIGVIAQEVEENFPELVMTRNGFKAVAYQNLLAVVIEAMKELDQRATELSDEYAGSENITQLMSQYNANAQVIDELESRVTALENSQGE